MKYERPYHAEEDIEPGLAVAQGADENGAIVADGTNDFLGIFEFENSRDKRLAGKENLGIVMFGLAKVKTGGQVTAGKKGIVKNDGTIIICPTAPGTYRTVGMFLETLDDPGFVDFFVERETITIS